MKEEILLHQNNPIELEKLYRADKSAFKRAFTNLSTQLKDHNLVAFWNARLNFVKEEISSASRADLIFLLIAALIAGTIAKLPALFNIDEEFFYQRNIGFIIFPALSAYFAWKNWLRR